MTQNISIGAIVAGAWRNFTENLVLYAKFVGWGMVLSASIWLLAALLGLVGLGINLSGAILAAATVLITVGFSVIWLAVIWAVSRTLTGGRPRVGEAFGAGLHRFVSFVWVNLLVFAAVIGGLVLAALCLLPPVWLAYSYGGRISPILVFLAFLPFLPALFLPIWFYTRYQFSINFLVVDGIRGTGALAASRRLVAGRFWPTFFRLAVPIVLFSLAARFTVFLAFLAAGSIAGDPKMFFNPIYELAPGADIKIMTVNLLASVIYLFVLPLFVSSNLILWNDLKRTRG